MIFDYSRFIKIFTMIPKVPLFYFIFCIFTDLVPSILRWSGSEKMDLTAHILKMYLICRGGLGAKTWPLWSVFGFFLIYLLFYSEPRPLQLNILAIMGSATAEVKAPVVVVTDIDQLQVRGVDLVKLSEFLQN